MFCSTIIPTIGRAELARAVNSVLDQAFAADSFEVIVVNDSGRLLPEEDWQKSDRVQLINTNRRERSFARNTGAAIARGRYLHFLDDDDWFLPNALNCFWKLAHENKAGWLYGGTQLVNQRSEQEVLINLGRTGNCFTQTMSGEWIPLQSSLIKTEIFFRVGGFDPLTTPGEDANLCQRIALQSIFAHITETVAVVTRGNESSTDYGLALEASRRGREQILDKTATFGRLRHSSNSGYWHAKLVRTYLFSVIWNLQHKRILTAMERGVFCLVSFILAGEYLLTSAFWQAITRKHTSTITSP